MVSEGGIAGFAGRLWGLMRKSFDEWLAQEPEVEEIPPAPDFEEQRKKLASSLPTGYSLIGESRDGKLCLFQDKDGHLTVVDARKFI